MNNSQLMRVMNMLLRGRTRSRWSLIIVVLIAAYLLLQPRLGPILAERFGVSLPSLDNTRATRNADDPDIDFEVDLSDIGTTTTATSDGENAILAAFKNRQSDLIVTTTATIKKNLPDDNIGSRHQKAILRLPSGHTVLLAHNIDLAEKVPFREGDTIEVRGKYEYTDKGGVIHWTHHDPRGRHPDGWIEYKGATYK